MWERRWVQVTVAAIGFPLFVVGIAAVVGALAGGDPTSWGAVIFLVTGAAFGTAVRHWWAILLPSLWAAVYLGVLRIIDLITHACHACGGDEDWSNYPLFVFVLSVLPITATVLVGVCVRAAVEWWRGSPRADGRYQPS